MAPAAPSPVGAKASQSASEDGQGCSQGASQGSARAIGDKLFRKDDQMSCQAAAAEVVRRDARGERPVERGWAGDVRDVAGSTFPATAAAVGCWRKGHQRASLAGLARLAWLATLAGLA